MRKNFARTHIMIDLITMLQVNPMTEQEIKQFLYSQYRARHLLRRGTYEISDKTVQRWLSDIKKEYPGCLTKEGEDPETEKPRYQLYIDDYPAVIEETELQALHNAIKRISNDPNARATLGLLEAKLWNRFQTVMKHKSTNAATYYRELNESDMLINSEMVVVGPRARFDIDPNIKKTIDKAIVKSEKVIIEYHGAKRTIRPMGVFYGDNNVYLVAFAEKDGKPVDTTPWTYRLSDITDARNTRQRFPSDPTFSIKDYTNKMFGVYNDRNIYDIEWLIDKSVVPEAKRYTFHPSQGDFIDNPDGSATLRMRCGGLDAICSHLFQWNGKITPVAPAELVARYRERLKNTLATLPAK
ncbi:MAG: WYL domain-containing protein [Alphaproteobacteria bacterium]|nr:WYL domain-containing protein [Alphaproteobacteria bacterium]